MVAGGPSASPVGLAWLDHEVGLESKIALEGGRHLGPLGHSVLSAGVGTAVWASTDSLLAIPVAFAAGILPDLDHVTDFFDSRDEGRNCHMLRPFHAWEYFVASLVVVLAFYSGPLFWAALLGYLGHLALDQTANRTHPLAYFIIYRASKGFRRRHLTPHIFDPKYIAERESMSFWGRLEPSIWRLVTKLRGKRR